MDVNLSDIVRDYELTTRFEGTLTIHFHNDSDTAPSAPARQEVWKKEKNIGRGDQGEVFLQTCVEGRRHYTYRAVKKIWLQNSKANSKPRYERELAAIVKFSHRKYSKYFVKSFGWYTSPEELYIAMEYFPQGDLYTYVHERRTLTEKECRQVTYQVLSGISLMHAEGYAHRDIKPQNILIYRHPQDNLSTLWWIKLADFGISKRFSPDAPATTTASIGSLEYMAPELLQAKSPTTLTRDYQRADIWALGITAFFIFTKSVPFQGRDSTIQFATNLGEPFPRGPLDQQNMGKDGQDFIRDAMKPQPDARPDCGLAIRHAWIQAIFSEASATSIPDRTTASSETSYSASDTEGISTLGSRPDSPELTVENETFVVEPPYLAPRSPGPLESEYSEELMVAVRTENIDRINRLLDRGANVNIPGPDGSLPLSISASKGNMGLTRTLVERGAEIMAFDSKGYTALHWAIKNNQVDIMKLLIDCGFNVKAKDSLGGTPLLLAAELGSEAAVRLVIDNSGSLEARHRGGYTPLMKAIFRRHFNVTKLLLVAGADYNARGPGGFTPLILAASRNCESIANLLIRCGAKLDESLLDGTTSLIIAASEGYQDTLKVLLQAGSDIEAKGKFGETALILAAGRGRLAVVEMLLEKGADIEAKNRAHATALIKAVANQCVSIVELLLKKGANCEAKDIDGRRCLVLAASQKDKSIMNLLLEKGAKKGLAYHWARF